MKLKVKVSTNKTSSQSEKIVEIDAHDLEDCFGDEREQFLEEVARDAMFEMIDWNYEVIEE